MVFPRLSWPTQTTELKCFQKSEEMWFGMNTQFFKFRGKAKVLAKELPQSVPQALGTLLFCTFCILGCELGYLTEPIARKPRVM
eukprot:4004570-Amphidinium_carterae.1